MSGIRVRWRAMALLVFAAIAVGCAPMQVVPLDLGPPPVELYVDGERAETVPAEVELRADRPHKLFVKREGYVPELVVLETSERDGRDALSPDVVRVRLQPVIGDHEVSIEDSGPAAGSP